MSSTSQSTREKIAIDIVSVLKQIDNPKPILVTREPIKPADVSQAQMPALLIRTLGETRSDEAMGSTLTRLATIQYEIRGYTRVPQVDTQVNEMVEAIETKLDADRTRGGDALNTTVDSVEANTDVTLPYGEFVMIVNVLYKFNRGVL
tara:strand:+ start:1231 stop:1674 length:444 start_codon:yes stop_codon:yes gene_type:complete